MRAADLADPSGAGLPASGPRRGRRAPAWLEDCATQLLIRAMMEEARTRLAAEGRPVAADAPVEPTTADLARAARRLSDTVDNLMTLSGLVPLAHAGEATTETGAF